MRPLVAASTFLRLLSIKFSSRRLNSSAIGLTCTLWEPSSEGLGIHGQRDIFVGCVDEELVRVLRRAQRPAVDRNQIVAFFHRYARFGQGRAGLRVPVFSGDRFS